MTHAEFHRAAKALAGNEYMSTKVEVSEHKDGQIKIDFSIYTSSRGWTRDCLTAEAALAEISRPPQTKADVERLGDVAAELGQGQ